MLLMIVSVEVCDFECDGDVFELFPLYSMRKTSDESYGEVSDIDCVCDAV